MPDESNPYAAVLADLEKERDQINGMIAMMKRRMGLSVEEGPVVTALASGNSSVPEGAQIRSDTFFGMAISDAIRKYLAMVKRPQRASEIAKALDEGGLLHSSKSWLATVQTTLTRMKGVVVRVPNGWGLMEWYPGRNFEKTNPTAKQPQKRAAAKANRRGKKAAKRPASPSSPKEPDASRQQQGHYLGLLKKFPESKRDVYKKIGKEQGREAAMKAMAHDLKPSEKE